MKHAAIYPVIRARPPLPPRAVSACTVNPSLSARAVPAVFADSVVYSVLMKAVEVSSSPSTKGSCPGCRYLHDVLYLHEPTNRDTPQGDAVDVVGLPLDNRQAQRLWQQAVRKVGLGPVTSLRVRAKRVRHKRARRERLPAAPSVRL